MFNLQKARRLPCFLRILWFYCYKSKKYLNIANFLLFTAMLLLGFLPCALQVTKITTKITTKIIDIWQCFRYNAIKRSVIMGYVPPFYVTNEMLDLTVAISEKLGSLSALNNLDKFPQLRRVNRLKSIQSSLAIENNTLSLQQVTDVINGKRVLGPQDDVIAARNAFEAYKQLESVDVYRIDDLLRVHGIMMKGLVDGAGELRKSGVGVFGSDGRVIHVAPPAQAVTALLQDLFQWARESKVNMLIKSCVFHYEFEFIHPFNDGNGRMGRLWQTALLSSWKPIFQWIPIESIIKDNQQDYYEAIRQSTSNGKSNAFVEFMLDAIYTAICNVAGEAAEHRNHVDSCIGLLLGVMETYPLTAAEIMKRLGLKAANSFRKNYLLPAIKAGYVAMTEPDKPTSRNQRYYKI